MEQIGRHYYKSIKGLANLTEEQRQQIDAYENRSYVEMTEEQKKFREDYWRKITADKPEDIILDKYIMWKQFKQHYKELYNVDFILTEESTKSLKTVFYYFLRDTRFFDCKNLSTLSSPSFNKGLLIVGAYGVSKSSIMNAMRHVLMGTDHSYAFKNMNNVVSEFEMCAEPEDKVSFWKMATSGRCLFDDIKTERQASNYGKTNLFKDIFELRCQNSLITHVTCNYREGSTSVEDAVIEIGERYGSRVYDRIFEKFNIIEFKGKSFRK